VLYSSQTSELESVILTTLFLLVQLVGKEGGFAACFSMDVFMVTLRKLSFIANGNNPIGVGLAPGETTCFGSLEFTADHFGHLSLSPDEQDSSAIFVGMVHNGSPSLSTALEYSSDEDGACQPTSYLPLDDITHEL
jgi:hypothetical protein